MSKITNFVKSIFSRKDTVVIISLILFATKIVGLIKLRAISATFGATRETDLFWAASIIPDTLFNILIAGSINAAVIPVFSDVLHKQGEKKLVKLFSMLTLYLSLILLLLATIAFIYAPLIAEFMSSRGLFTALGSGLGSVAPEELSLLVKLIRIMLLSPVLLSISAIIAAFLQVHRNFFITTLAPLMYNLASVIIITQYQNVFGHTPSVSTLAWAIVVGSVVHILTQLPILYGFIKEFLHIDHVKNIKGSATFYFGEVMHIFKLSFPRMLGIMGEYGNVAINTMIGLSLREGALTAYRYAMSLYVLPSQIFATAIAQKALPDLAQFYAEGKMKEFKASFNKALRWTLFLMIPAAISLFVLRLPIVRLAYGAGEFDWWATVVTSWALALLGGAVIGQSVVAISMRAFFAMKETRMPLIATAVTIVVNVITAYYFTNFFSHYMDWRPILFQIGNQLAQGVGEGGAGGFFTTLQSFASDLGVWFTTREDYDAAVGGLSLALTASFLAEMVVSLALLQKKAKLMSFNDTWRPIIKMVSAGIPAGLIMYVVYRLCEMLLDTSYVANLLITFVASLGSGGLVYVAYAWFMDIPEIHDIINAIVKLPPLKRFKAYINKVDLV